MKREMSEECIIGEGFFKPYMRYVSVRGDTFLFRKDFSAEGVYFLKRGSVKLMRRSNEGREFTFGLI